MMSEAISDKPLEPIQHIEHVFALRRSGHHAVMKWLEDCYKAKGETVTLANDVYLTHIRPDAVDLDSETILDKASSSQVVFSNYQDVSYAKRRDIRAYAELQSEHTKIPTHDTVIVRDWYNMIASRWQYIASREGTSSPSKTMAAMGWAALADIWIENATLLRHTPLGDDSLTCISFNQWFSNPEYVQDLARRYDLPNATASRNTVPAFGSGSSFDGQTKDGNAQEMRILERWQSLDVSRVEGYLEIINATKSIVDPLNRELFGFGYDEVVQSLEQGEEPSSVSVYVGPLHS